MDSPRKKVVVTGASSGLGLAITHSLLENHFEVWGTSRSIHRLPQHPHFHPITLDLESKESIQHAAQTIRDQCPQLHALINNAGSGIFSPMDSTPLESFDQQWRILVRGPYQFLQELLPSLKASPTATVVQITSLAARLPIPMMGSYSMGKAALSALTQSLQIENAHPSIHYVDLQPGDIRTEFNQSMPEVGSLSPTAHKIRQKIDQDMAQAPHPDCVSKIVLNILQNSNPSPQYRVGDLFQSQIAPFLQRIVPRSWLNWGIRRYYKE